MLLRRLMDRAQGTSREVLIPRLDEVAKPASVKSVVTDWDNRDDDNRALEGDGLLHVSSLVGACPRRLALARAMPVHRKRRVFPSDRLVWRIGRAVESHVRESYIAATGGRDLLGDWSCDCGNARAHWCTAPEDRRCTCCGGKLRHYRELALINEEFGVIGSPDMVLTTLRGLVPVEIKSMARQYFDRLESPVADHLFQVCAYHELLRMAGHEMADYVVVLYARKEYHFANPYKEFVVPLDDLAHVLDNVREKFSAARMIHSGQMPPRRERCASITDAPKTCEVVGQCFLK